MICAIEMNRLSETWLKAMYTSLLIKSTEFPEVSGFYKIINKLLMVEQTGKTEISNNNISRKNQS